ncbi:MAG: hypothetical protein RL071_2575 [Pseudomonadota bacterium]
MHTTPLASRFGARSPLPSVVDGGGRPRSSASAPALGLLTLVLAGAALGGCATEAPPPAAAEDKCPRVTMDLEGQWLRVNGNAGDPKHRFEVQKKGADTVIWYVGGAFTKKELRGERRDTDWRFTQAVSGAQEEAFKKGELELTRVFVEPQKKLCALRVSVGTVKWDAAANKERETIAPGFQEFLPMPEGGTFTFRPCDGTLFFAKAAADWTVAEAELKNGGAVFNTALGEALSVGAWTDAAADGDAACTYDMDLYFDDKPAKDKENKARGPAAAGAVVSTPAGDKRPWTVPDWFAPWSGNHHFEVYRYRSCAGGPRELLGVSCSEAVLQ